MSAEQPQPTVSQVAGLKVRHLALGSGPPVVVLPGWGAYIEAVMPIGLALQSEHTVHLIDLPGFGESQEPPEPWSADDYREFVVAFMDQFGIERADLVGHSHGGRTAISLAATYPERLGKLILIDSAGLKPKRGLGYYWRVGLAKVGKYAAKLFGKPGQRLRQRIAKGVGSADYVNASETMRGTLVRLVNADLSDLLPKIQSSTLLVWGELDEDTPLWMAQRLENEIPDAGLVVFAGAGHYSYADEPAQFARVASHFLRPAQPEAAA